MFEYEYNFQIFQIFSYYDILAIIFPTFSLNTLILFPIFVLGFV